MSIFMLQSCCRIINIGTCDCWIHFSCVSVYIYRPVLKKSLDFGHYMENSNLMKAKIMANCPAMNILNAMVHAQLHPVPYISVKTAPLSQNRADQSKLYWFWQYVAINEQIRKNISVFYSLFWWANYRY